MRAGEVIAGRFHLEKLAGSGGMGAVWQALDEATGRHVAVKVMLEHATDKRRFVREAEVLARMHHDAIVQYVAHGATEDGLLYFAMEWLEGCDLATYLEGRGPQRVAPVLDLGIRLSEALALAHDQGVVHRDVKPANVFLVGGRLEDARLIDFGIAHVAAMTPTGPVGTLGYMAPEQARAGASIDARADVFSLGCVLFEMLTGKPVFAGAHAIAVLAKVLVHEPERLSELMAGVPRELDELLAGMLHKDPADRPVSMRAVASVLRALLSREHVSLMPQLAPHGPSLSGDELAVATVALVRRGGDLMYTRTMDATEVADDVAKVDKAVRPFEVRLERLVDGSLMAIARSRGEESARDVATRAVKAALVLHRLTGRPTAVATGPAAMRGRIPLGEAIDVAVGMLVGGEDVVRADEATTTLVRGRFDLEGDVVVRERSTGVLRKIAGQTTPFVGREREIALVSALFDECVDDGSPRVALLVGASGSGKSRLASEIVARAMKRAPKVRAWSARGDIGAESPLSLLRRLLGRVLGTTRDEVAARVHDAHVASFLCDLLELPDGAETSLQLASARNDPRLMADQLRSAFEAFVIAESRAAPLLVIVEDIQWADAASLAFLDAVLRAAKTPLMVLGTARAEVREHHPSLWRERHVQEVDLLPLSKRMSERLVRDLAPSASPDVVASIVERGEGQPLFLEQLARAAASGDSELPRSVLAMVVHRVERLPPDERRLLRAAAVFGRSFWRRGLVALTSVTEEEIDRMLGHLVIAEQVSEATSRYPGEQEYAFKHALTRDGAYGMLTSQDAELGHRLAGEWLESVGEHDALLLAHHFEKGNVPERARLSFARGAHLALDVGACEVAVAAAEKAIAHGASGDLEGEMLLVQARGHQYLAHLDHAAELGRRALERLPVGSAPACDALALLGLVEFRRNRPVEAARVAERLLEMGELPPGPAARLLELASALVLAGKVDLGKRLFVRVTGSLPERSPAAGQAAGFEAMLSLVAGDVEGALRATERAIRALDDVGDGRAAATERLNAAYFRLELGDHERAHALLREVSEQRSRLGLGETTHNLARVLERRGQLAEAADVCRATAAAAAESGDRRVEGFSRAHLASLLLQRGAIEEAEREARHAVRLLEDAPSLRPVARAMLSNALRARGALAEALEHAKAAAEAAKGGVESGEMIIALALAEALQATGDEEGARIEIAAAKERLDERAARIRDATLAASFLERVPENARVLELARASAQSSIA